jgi:hypothetical protein
MILDERTEFCDATVATRTLAQSAILGDVIDLGATPTTRDLGLSDGPWLVIQVTTAFVGATSTTEFQLLSDSTANLATSATLHWTSGAIPVATLVEGYEIAVKLPSGSYERYLGLWEINATAATTAGAVNAFLTPVYAKNINYTDQF